MTGITPAAGAGHRGRRWERGLLGALAGLSALAWLGTGRLAMPGMRAGILTGRGTGSMDGGGAPMALGLFLLTWVVMMAAMMLPAAAPVVLAVDRWARRTAGPGWRPPGSSPATWRTGPWPASAPTPPWPAWNTATPRPAPPRCGPVRSCSPWPGSGSSPPSSRPACASADHPWPSSPPAPIGSGAAG
jgi:hypothetical protein